jgi:TonB family protein
MNAPAAPLPRWSTRRWLLTIAVVLLLQLAVVLAFSVRRLPPPRAPGASPAIRVLENGGSRRGSLPPGTDPTVFTLVSRRGFSGRGWIDFDFVAYESRDWQDEPRWLELRPAYFGAEFRKLAARLTPSQALPDKPPPRPPALSVAPVPLRPHTTWELSAELRGRPLMEPVELPDWPHPDVLGHTVLQLTVLAGGDVLSVNLLRRCGLAAADARAMESFARARFRPLPREGAGSFAPSPATIGTVTVAWVTRPPEPVPSPAP